MATSAPVMALGLEIPNASFSIPSDTANIPAGWTVSGTLTSAAYYTGGPSPGHQRWQRFTHLGATTTAATVTSNAAPPYKFCGNSATSGSVFLHVRTSGIVNANTRISFQIGWYDSSDALIGATTELAYFNADPTHIFTDWTVVKATKALTPPLLAHHAKELIVFSRTGATPGTNLVLDVAFFGVGLWPSSGYYSLPTPSHPGTVGRRSYRSNEDTDAYGHRTRVDTDRYVDPHKVDLTFAHLTNTHKLALEYAHAMNGGRAWEGATTNPNGGSWPIILVPGQPSCIGVGMFDIDATDFPLSLFPGYYTDPPYWQGTMPFVEVL